MKRTMKVMSIGFMFLAVFLSPIHVAAADSHSHWEETISPGYSWYMYGTINQYSGEYGSFSTTGNDITFYLVDSDNFAKWSDSQSFSSYKSLEDVYSGSYTFRIPFTDTWYFIFDNRDSYFHTTTLVFDSYVDNTAPTFTVSLSNGATYSGIKTIDVSAQDAKFSVASTKLYIDNTLEKTENDGSFSYNWDTTDYSNGQHTIRVTVSDNVLNTDYREYVVNVNNVVPTSSTSSGGGGINSPAPNVPASSASMVVPIAGFLIGVISLIGLALVYSKKRGTGVSPKALISSISKPPSPEAESVSYSTQQKPQVLTSIVCPFCGSRTQGGLPKCQLCGADL
jgi:hypothetical protein